MPTPRPNRTRPVQTIVWWTKDEKEAVTVAAASAGLPLSSWLRMVALRAARKK